MHHGQWPGAGGHPLGSSLAIACESDACDSRKLPHFLASTANRAITRKSQQKYARQFVLFRHLDLCAGAGNVSDRARRDGISTDVVRHS
jgi:hypothetical protein